MDVRGEHILPCETDMINCNFWYSIRQVISLIGSLQPINAVVLRTRDEADALRAAHYDWSVTRQEVLRKIAYMKQLINQPPDDDPSRSSDTSTPFQTTGRNQDEGNTDGNSGLKKEEDAVPMETCKMSSDVITPESPPSSDVGDGRSSLFLNSTSRITGNSDPPIEYTTPSNSPLRTKLQKPDFDEAEENDCAEVGMSSKGGNPSGQQDELRSRGQRRFLIVESGAALDKYPFSHIWIYEDELIPFQAALYSLSCPCSLNVAVVLCEISALLREDKIFGSKLLTQWSEYVLSCEELLQNLATLQRNRLLHHLMREIVSSTFNHSSFSQGLIRDYREMRASPVEILVDVLSHLRASSHLRSVADFVYHSRRCIQLVSLNRAALLRLRISSDCQTTRRQSALFLASEVELLREDIRDRLRQHQSSVSTSLEPIVNIMAESYLGPFNSSGNPEFLNEVLDSMSAEVQESLDTYESLKGILFVEPTVLQSIVSFGISTLSS